MPDLRHDVVTSLRWSAFAKFGGQLASWAITIFVIRLLVPGDYGLMAISNVFMGLLAIVAEMGFGASLIQATELNRARIRQLFGAAVIANVGIFLTLVASAPLIARFYAEPRLVFIVQVSAIQFLIGTISLVPDALLRRSLAFKKLSVIEVGSALCGNACTLACALSGRGVWSLVLGALAGAGMRAILLQSAVRDRITPSFHLTGIRSLIAFGANVTSTRIIWYLFTQCDTLIAGKVLGKEALGLYSVAVHLATLPMQRLSSIINDVAFPAFSRIQSDRRAVTDNLRLAVRLIALLAFPVLWGLASVAPELVRLAMGARWVDATVPLQIVAIVIPLRMVNAIVSTATVSTGHAGLGLRISVLSTLIAPPVFYVGAQFGIIGLSIAWLGLTPILTGINVYRSTSRVHVSIKQIVHDMARPACAALLMAIGVYAVRLLTDGFGDGARVTALIVAGAAFYFAATVMVNREVALKAIGLMIPRSWITAGLRVYEKLRKLAS